MKDFIPFFAAFFLYVATVAAAVAQVQPGVYSFAGAPSNGVPADGTTKLVMSDGFFALVGLDGSGSSPPNTLMGDRFGSFIQDASSASGTSWIELRVANGGTFTISGAVIGDYNGSGDPHDFYDIYAVGLLSGVPVAQTGTHSSVGVYESDYGLNFSLFTGVTIDALRVYYSWNSLGAHGQNGFNLTSVTVASTAAPDTTAPTVSDTHIAISGASGTGGAFKIGDTVTATWNNSASGDNNSDVASVTVNFSQFGGGAAVTATNNGGIWTATYTIVSGSVDQTSRNVSVSVTDTSSNNRVTSDTTNATVDNVAPTVTDGRIAISGASGSGGAFKIGDTVTATWSNTALGDNNADTISSVTVDFSQFGGGVAVAATNSSGTWTATFTIVSGAIDTTSRNVSVTATDNAGNATTTADTTNATVDNVLPTLTTANVTVSGQSGLINTFKIGDTVTVTWNNTAAGDNNSDTISSVMMDFTSVGGPNVAATNNAGLWTASFVVAAGVRDTTIAGVAITVTDNAGNDFLGYAPAYRLDNVAPVVTDANISVIGGSGTGGAFRSGNTVTVSWKNTGGDANTDTITSVTVNFSAFGGGAAVAATNTSGTWTATYVISNGSLDVTNVNVSVTVTDNAGNTTTTADTRNATLDNQKPTVTGANLSITGGTGTGGAFIVGDTVTVTWDNSATGDNNTDISTVTFNLIPFGGSGLTAATNNGGVWTATHVIAAGATDSASIIFSIRATDDAGNLTILADDATVVLDARRPFVTDANISVSGASGPGGVFIIGDTVTVTWNNTLAGENNIDTIAGAAVDFAQFGGGSAVAATNSGGIWTATYTIVAGAISATNITAVVSATDDAGNVTTTPDGSQLSVDNVVPSVTAVTSATADGTYRTGDQIVIQLDFNETVLVTGTPQLTLETGTVDRVADYAGGSGTAALTFSYTVQAGDSAADLDYLSAAALALAGGTIEDSVTNDASLSLPVPGAAGSLSASKALVIDTAAPTVTALSPATGTVAGGDTVVITGTGFSAATAVSFGGTVSPGFTVNSDTQITATTPAGAAGALQVTVTNPNGTSTTGAASTYTYTTVPGQPVIGVATPLDGQVSVTFAAPAGDGGNPILSYAVTSAPGNITVTGAGSPILVTGLTNGVAYTFTVTATNAMGEGAASAASNAATPKGDQVISFANPGAQTFGTQPTVSATASSGGTVTFASGTPGVCTVTGGGLLTFLTAGSCTIDADQAGDGVWNAAPTLSQTFTVNAVVPAAPTIGTATAGDTQATVTFVPPGNTGGVAITGYTVTASPGGLSATGAASPITVPGLTNGLSYTFTVSASNLVGSGPGSAASNAVMPAAGQTISFANPGAQLFGTAPTLSATATSGEPVSFSSTTTGVCTVTSGGALTFLTAGICSIDADQAGNVSWSAAPTVTQSFAVHAVLPGAPTLGAVTPADRQVTVAFAAPDFTGGEMIVDYDYSLDGGLSWQSAGTRSSPVTITGLTNGTTYGIALRAVTDVGAGPASTVEAAMPVALPGAPTALVVTVGDGMLTVGFAAPGDTGGLSVTDYDYSLDGGLSWTGAGTTSSPVIITGLTNGTSYDVALRAVTGLGAGVASAVETATPVTTADAPTALVVTAGDGMLTVGFAAPGDTGGAAITGYDYSLDGGVSWTGSGTASSPVIITGLTNGTSYDVALRAVTGAGAGAASAVETATPVTVAHAPTALVVTAGDGMLTVAFVAPGDTGGMSVTDYDYSLDGGVSWTSAGTVSSPITITGLANGTSYDVALRAVTGVGAGAASAVETATPVTTADAPTALVVTAGDGSITIAFAAPADTGGAAITGYDYSLDGGLSWTGAGTTQSPFTVTGLANGASYDVALRAVTPVGPGAMSAVETVLLGSPAQAFEEAEEDIRAVIVEEAIRSLDSTIAANRAMVREAGDRLRARTRCEAADARCIGPRAQPFDIDGSAEMNGATLSTSGTFGALTVLDGTTERLVFGSFDFRHDAETGTGTATLTARVAWERMVGGRTLLGYFLGGEVAQSRIAGAFAGDQSRVGVTAGSYALHRLGDALVIDGYLSFGAGRNDLAMADDILALDTSYATRTATLGLALSGLLAGPGYEIRPELALSLGRTWIGDVGFAGAAYGLEDGTLALDLGSIRQAEVSFRPEVVVPLDGASVPESRATLSFAPRFGCTRVEASGTTEEDCHAGAELGLVGRSGDDLTRLSARVTGDWHDGGARPAVELAFEHRF